MTLKDIGTYKTKLMSTIITSDDICELMLGKGYNQDTVDDDLIYSSVFPYLYANDTQVETKSFICMEVDVPRIANFSIKDMKIIIWCYCHKDKDYMRYSKKGYLGTRADILTDMLDRKLQSSRDFGIGRLQLDSVSFIPMGNKYYGKQLIYSCSEFNLEDKL